MKAKITDMYMLSNKTRCFLIFGDVVDVGAGKLVGLPVKVLIYHYRVPRNDRTVFQDAINITYLKYSKMDDFPIISQPFQFFYLFGGFAIPIQQLTSGSPPPPRRWRRRLRILRRCCCWWTWVCHGLQTGWCEMGRGNIFDTNHLI